MSSRRQAARCCVSQRRVWVQQAYLQQVAEPDGCVGGAAVRAGPPCGERALKAPGEALPLLCRQLIVIAAVSARPIMALADVHNEFYLCSCTLYSRL
jgi:hypothetical protein